MNTVELRHVIKMMPGGIRAVNGVSLCIQAGERVLIHGEPGSGKSTLMRLIAGMDEPSDGEIYVLGEAVHAMDADAATDFRNAHIGVMLRDPCLLSGLSVLDNVALPLAIRGIPVLQRRQAARKQLKALGIGHIAHTLPGQAGAYETQAVSLARALIGQPSILLLDEIFAGLTVRDSEQLAGVIDAVSRFTRLTVILFSASARYAIDADRTTALDHGTIWEDRS